MNYQETLTLDEYKAVLLFRLRLAAQLLLNAERPGETVRQIQIDTNTAAVREDAPVPDELKTVIDNRRYYVMYRSKDGVTWPATAISQGKGFATFEEAEKETSALMNARPSNRPGYYYVIGSTIFPDGTDS